MDGDTGATWDECGQLVFSEAEEKRPADIAYDFQGISGLMSTIALAVANSSLQVSMTVLL